MKTFGKIKKLVALLFALVLAFALCSCGAVETERGNEIKLKCEVLINALIAKDAEAAYATFPKEMNKEAFLQNFQNLCKYVEEVETYELTQTGWRSGIDNGKSYYIATYAMMSNSGNFTVEITEVEGYEGIYNFRIVSDEDYKNATENYTGTLTKMQGASPFQWGMIIFSALCLGFVIWMLVDCVKRKIRYKPLWIVIILCGAVVLTFTLNNNGANFNTTVAMMLFNYSYLQIYGTGASILNVTLPAGAIVYLILRKKFIVVPAQYGEAPEDSEPIRQESPEPETIPETIEIGEESEE